MPDLTDCDTTRTDTRLDMLLETTKRLMGAALLMPEAGYDHELDIQLRCLHETAERVESRLTRWRDDQDGVAAAIAAIARAVR